MLAGSGVGMAGERGSEEEQEQEDAKEAMRMANAPLSARAFVSTQSKPAPAAAMTFMLDGNKSISGLSHGCISPPVLQRGFIMAEKLPHVPSLRCWMKVCRSRSAGSGRMMWN